MVTSPSSPHAHTDAHPGAEEDNARLLPRPLRPRPVSVTADRESHCHGKNTNALINEVKQDLRASLRPGSEASILAKGAAPLRYRLPRLLLLSLQDPLLWNPPSVSGALAVCLHRPIYRDPPPFHMQPHCKTPQRSR